MENKKSYNAEVYQPIKKDEYIYHTPQVYGCARIIPPEERKKLRKNKQSNI